MGPGGVRSAHPGKGHRASRFDGGGEQGGLVGGVLTAAQVVARDVRDGFDLTDHADGAPTRKRCINVRAGIDGAVNSKG